MRDAFAEFDLERRPWLDACVIHARYLELAPSRHPDRCAGDSASLIHLHEARKILSSHSTRLRHLLDLTFPGTDYPNESSLNFELFSLVGNFIKSVDSLTKKYERSESALARALIKSESFAIEQAFCSARKQMSDLHEKMETRIRQLNALWPDVSPESLSCLAKEAAFCDRWNKSLHEAGVKLLGSQ